MFLVWLSRLGHAGYADAQDGLPTYEDRETFLWTNAVRIEPAAFQNDYPCSFSSFSSAEQTTKKPLLFDAGLAEAASYHSHDMDDQDYFDHDSIDGTSWDDRIFRYYSGSTIGENIAWGYNSPYSAVVEGWMCSSEHRANIMSPDFEEMGTGVAGVYYTQDFGGGGAVPDRGMAMGLHQPQNPGADVSLTVDWDGPSAPDAIYVVLGDPDAGAGQRNDLSLLFGTDARGLYSITTAAGAGCTAYYFVALLGSARETWPEEGSYGFGACDWDDAGARWLDLQLPEPDDIPETTDPGTTNTTDAPTGDDDDDDDDDDDVEDTGGKTIVTPSCECASPLPSSGSTALSTLALLSLVAGRRRAR